MINKPGSFGSVERINFKATEVRNQKNYQIAGFWNHYTIFFVRETVFSIFLCFF